MERNKYKEEIFVETKIYELADPRFTKKNSGFYSKPFWLKALHQDYTVPNLMLMKFLKGCLA